MFFQEKLEKRGNEDKIRVVVSIRKHSNVRAVLQAASQKLLLREKKVYARHSSMETKGPVMHPACQSSHWRETGVLTPTGGSAEGVTI